MAQKYEYVYAGDELDDDNGGLVYGVRDWDGLNPCGCFYMEWFRSIGMLEANTRNHRLNVTNRREFLDRFKVKG